MDTFSSVDLFMYLLLPFDDNAELIFMLWFPANESTRKRVMFYTMAEYIAFMAASALQVLYIRRLFSKNVGYNRV
jgi:hypothetical protein